MKIKLIESASRELFETYDFYEKQGEGLGAHFASSVFAEIDSLGKFGGIHPVFFGRYHRLVCTRFPFTIYYSIDGDVVIIRAIIDSRRDPEWIEEQLD